MKPSETGLRLSTIAMTRAALLLLIAVARASFTRVKFDVITTAGADSSSCACTTSGLPRGAQLFLELVAAEYFDDSRFFRYVEGFVVQFGLAGSPTATARWRDAIKDDPVKTSNSAGTVTFATAGRDSRTTQLFVNLADNANLDAQGFAPFGVLEAGGLAVARAVYDCGDAPEQHLIELRGNTYLDSRFPQLSRVRARASSRASRASTPTRTTWAVRAPSCSGASRRPRCRAKTPGRRGPRRVRRGAARASRGPAARGPRRGRRDRPAVARGRLLEQGRPGQPDRRLGQRDAAHRVGGRERMDADRPGARRRRRRRARRAQRAVGR